MDNYYVLRRGKVFLDLHLDFRSAREWHNAGWEVCPQDSKEAAQHIMEMWKAGLWTSPSSIRTGPAA